MPEAIAVTRAIIIERYLAHALEKVWRALTEGPLLETWLMPGDFESVVGHHFNFRVNPVANWNGVTEGEVLEVEPLKRLVYRWCSKGAAPDGLKTIVTWTLEPTASGTLLRMEQTGFRPQDEPNYQGATQGWGRFWERLEQLLEELAGHGNGGGTSS